MLNNMISENLVTNNHVTIVNQSTQDSLAAITPTSELITRDQVEFVISNLKKRKSAPENFKLLFKQPVFF